MSWNWVKMSQKMTKVWLKMTYIMAKNDRITTRKDKKVVYFQHNFWYFQPKNDSIEPSSINFDHFQPNIGHFKVNFRHFQTKTCNYLGDFDQFLVILSLTTIISDWKMVDFDRILNQFRWEIVIFSRNFLNLDLHFSFSVDFQPTFSQFFDQFQPICSVFEPIFEIFFDKNLPQNSAIFPPQIFSTI